MPRAKEYFVSTAEAQANISKMINFMTKANDRFVVTRYSKPVGVFLPYRQYQKLKESAKLARSGACRHCDF